MVAAAIQGKVDCVDYISHLLPFEFCRPPGGWPSLTILAHTIPTSVLVIPARSEAWAARRPPRRRSRPREIDKARRVFYYWRISAATASPNFFWISFWVSG